MPQTLETPDIDDLTALGVEVRRVEHPWVVEATSVAADGATVSVTWDEVANSVNVRWQKREDVFLVVEREMITKISASDVGGVIEFRIVTDAGELGGNLTVRVGTSVTVSDALLRK